MLLLIQIDYLIAVRDCGKSTITSYLWKMLEEAGFPTVLIDVDLRKSVMKTRFQMDYDDDTTMGLNPGACSQTAGSHIETA